MPGYTRTPGSATATPDAAIGTPTIAANADNASLLIPRIPMTPPIYAGK
jgi:hypothetical protein